MDGEADFMFDLPVYHLMKKRAPGMSFYDGYTEDEFVTIQVHVTENLTGNQVWLPNMRNVKMEKCKISGLPPCGRWQINSSSNENVDERKKSQL